MDNKVRFVDNSKKNSMQDRGMIIRFSNKAEGFFPLGTFIVALKFQISRLELGGGGGWSMPVGKFFKLTLILVPLIFCLS